MFVIFRSAKKDCNGSIWIILWIWCLLKYMGHNCAKFHFDNITISSTRYKTLNAFGTTELSNI